jgi:hypothetical protein
MNPNPHNQGSPRDVRDVPTLDPQPVVNPTPANGYRVYSDDRSELYDQAQAYNRNEQQ